MQKNYILNININKNCKFNTQQKNKGKENDHLTIFLVNGLWN